MIQIIKKLNDFVYFIFAFINGLKMVDTVSTFQIYDNLFTLLRLIVRVGGGLNCKFWEKNPQVLLYNYYQRMT